MERPVGVGQRGGDEERRHEKKAVGADGRRPARVLAESPPRGNYPRRPGAGPARCELAPFAFPTLDVSPASRPRPPRRGRPCGPGRPRPARAAPRGPPGRRRGGARRGPPPGPAHQRRHRRRTTPATRRAQRLREGSAAFTAASYREGFRAGLRGDSARIAYALGLQTGLQIRADTVTGIDPETFLRGIEAGFAGRTPEYAPDAVERAHGRLHRLAERPPRGRAGQQPRGPRAAPRRPARRRPRRRPSWRLPPPVRARPSARPASSRS